MEWASYDRGTRDAWGAPNNSAAVMPSVGLSVNPWDAAMKFSFTPSHSSASQPLPSSQPLPYSQPSSYFQSSTTAAASAGNTLAPYLASSNPYVAYQSVPAHAATSYQSNGTTQQQQQSQQHPLQQYAQPSLQAQQYQQRTPHQSQQSQLSYQQPQQQQPQQQQPQQSYQQQQQQTYPQTQQQPSPYQTSLAAPIHPQQQQPPSRSSEKLPFSHKASQLGLNKKGLSSSAPSQSVLPSISRLSSQRQNSVTPSTATSTQIIERGSSNLRKSLSSSQSGFITTSVIPPPSHASASSTYHSLVPPSYQPTAANGSAANRLSTAEAWTCTVCEVINVPKRMLCKACYRPRLDGVFDLDQYLIAFAEAAATGDFNMLDHICADFQIAGADDLECAQNVRKVMLAQSITEPQYLFIYEKLMDAIPDKFSPNQATRISKYRRILQIALSLPPPPDSDSSLSSRERMQFHDHGRGGPPDRFRRPSYFERPLSPRRDERFTPLSGRFDDYSSRSAWNGREDERYRRPEDSPSYSRPGTKRSRDWKQTDFREPHSSRGPGPSRRESRADDIPITYLPPITQTRSVRDASRLPTGPRSGPGKRKIPKPQPGEWKTISL